MSKIFPSNPPKSKEEMVKRLERLGEYLPTLDPFVRSIYEKFGFTAFLRSVIPCSGGEFVIEKYMKMVKPKRALVIGTNRGISTARVAQFCDHVDTIDVVESDLREKIWKHLGLEGKIKDHVVPSEKVAALIKTLNFDFCFMDGDHANHTESDFAAVRHCGNVLFHDYWEGSPVVKLVDRLKKDWQRQVFIEEETNFAFWTNSPEDASPDPDYGDAGVSVEASLKHHEQVAIEAQSPKARSKKAKGKKGHADGDEPATSA